MVVANTKHTLRQMYLVLLLAGQEVHTWYMVKQGRNREGKAEKKNK